MNHLSTTSTTATSQAAATISTTSTSNNQYIASSCLAYSKVIFSDVCKLMTPVISCCHNRISSSPLERQRICGVISYNDNATTTIATSLNCAICATATTATSTVLVAECAGITSIACARSTNSVNTTS